jgi:TolB-like protein
MEADRRRDILDPPADSGSFRVGASDDVAQDDELEPSADTNVADETDAVPSVPEEARPSRVRWVAASIVAGFLVAGLSLLLVLGFDVGGAGTWLRRESNRPVRALAVLPLENLSRDPSQDYLVDGLTEQLITTLAQLQGVEVISRTSAMQFKGTTKRPAAIGRELNVDALVEGSVLRSGQRVRITAQLVDARTDQHLWAQSYARPG